MDDYLFILLLRFRRIVIPLLIITLLNGIVSVHAEPHNKQIKAYRTYQSIEIDGDLTEEDWQHAEVMDRFVQVEPYEGEDLSEPMELRILYDDENIYFGFTCYDSEMSKTYCERNASGFTRPTRKRQRFCAIGYI